MKRLSWMLSFWCVFVGLTSAQAVEVDDISAYYAPLREATDVLNARVQEVLLTAINETHGCDISTFEKKVLRGLTPSGLIDRAFFGGMEKFALESPDVERFHTRLDESIYRGTPLERAFFVVAGQIFRFGDIFPSIRINGHTVGTDKLSHFFETGYSLYQTYLKESSLESLTEEQIQALVNEAVRLEDDELGITVTGIKSYADIVAHLQGALFWKALLSEDGGWVRCENERLTIQKSFDFRRFVHAGWSEAINCNTYAEGKEASSIFDLIKGPPPPFAATVRANAAQLEEETGQYYMCPIEPLGCEDARKALIEYDERLTPHIDRLISPACAAKESPLARE